MLETSGAKSRVQMLWLRLAVGRREEVVFTKLGGSLLHDRMNAHFPLSRKLGSGEARVSEQS